MSSVMGPPEGRCLLLSLRVRSALMRRQLCPSSELLSTNCAAVYRTFESCRETNTGSVHWMRYSRSAAPLPDTSSGCIETSRWLPVRRSEEHTSELQSRLHLVCRLLLEKKKTKTKLVSTTKDKNMQRPNLRKP